MRNVTGAHDCLSDLGDNLVIMIRIKSSKYYLIITGKYSKQKKIGGHCLPLSHTHGKAQDAETNKTRNTQSIDWLGTRECFRRIEQGVVKNIQ